MLEKTIKQLSDELHSKRISSVELTEFYLDRINALDKNINSYISVTDDHALLQAKAADKLIATGQAGPLTGIPIAQKDIFCTNGIKTTCASKMLDNFIAPYDATVISRFNAAGSVMLGKTNMDEFAMGSSNESSYYGAVKNPWNTNCVPGGSSGGSAAAVAARLAPAATGTDTGGSIRQPASMCNLTGLKPTYGRISRWGMIAFASSLDQAGPMCRNAEDAAMMLNVMAGFDSKDSTCVNQAVPDYTENLNKPLSDLKIGLPKEYFDNSLDENIARIIKDAIDEFKNIGANIIEIELPNNNLAIPAYYIVALAECSSNLSRYDGVRFGYRCEDPIDLEDLYKRSRGEAFGEEVKRRIMIGTYALSAGYYDAYYVQAQKIRQLISNDFKSAFEKVDVIMGPTSPSTAFKIGEKSNDPVTMYLSDIYTTAVNLAGLPGMSIPAGFSDSMPVGLQLIGNYFSESHLLNIAHQFQQVTDWHTQSPENY